MTNLDMPHLKTWIDHSETHSDTLTPRMIHEYKATFSPLGGTPSPDVPLGIHWCLAPVAAPASELGPDGHPTRGGFMPPVPLQRRMWAGGQVDFIAPILPNDTIKQHSTITGVEQKQGKTGPMVFVTVIHEYSTKRGLALRDRHDVVYLAPAGKLPFPTRGDKTPPEFDHSRAVETTSTLMFRYSAITFNGHRIHYDPDYARNEEGYPDLVVHGPMQAAFLLQYGQQLANGRALKSFSYRGLRPLYLSEPLTINAKETPEGLDLWTADSTLLPNMRGKLLLAKP